MIKTELVFDGAIDLPCKLHAVIWEPDDGKVDSVVQIVHGMTEHIGRYEDFAKEMTRKKWLL